MANIIKVSDISSTELDVYVRLTGAQLRCKLEPERGIFIAESPTVIRTALDAGYTPISFLTDEKLVNSDVKDIIDKISEIPSDNPSGIPIYIGERDVLKEITGFELTRGALSAMKRPILPSPKELLSGASRIAVLEEITDSTNIGAIFRSAAALGVDAVLITPTCCDPLCRRAIRVSMGTVFQVPWTRIGDSVSDWPTLGIELLKKEGFKTVAMALTDNSVPIYHEKLLSEEKLAIILGTEGDGLKKSTILSSDYAARIPMSHGVDSLNVGAAAAVAFWQLRKKPTL